MGPSTPPRPGSLRPRARGEEGEREGGAPHTLGIARGEREEEGGGGSWSS